MLGTQMQSTNQLRQETQCVHSGTFRDEATRGLNTPIFTSSSFEYLDRAEVPYPRYFNTANQESVVAKLCALEHAEDGLVFGSGMAAMSTALMACLGPGDEVVMQDELYGGTHAFATEQFRKLNIGCHFTATSAPAICAATTPRTKLILLESPTNPLLSVLDLKQVADFAKARGILTVIDNTFATPIYQQPIRLGIDLVVHSGTKYLGGHSDLCCGAVLGAKPLIRQVRHMARFLGGSLNAQTCYLLERSLKTLKLRVDQQTRNAGQVAAFLLIQSRVARVNYPGLPGHPGHGIAKSQMTGFGAMLSFELHSEAGDPRQFMRQLKLIKPAVSLGHVETTICSPVATSHSKMTPEARARVGITDRLLRLSVGIEHVDDLVADLAQALQ